MECRKKIMFDNIDFLPTSRNRIPPIETKLRNFFRSLFKYILISGRRVEHKFGKNRKVIRSHTG